MSNHLPYTFEEAEEANSLICCRDFGWVHAVTFTQAHETLEEGLQDGILPPSPKSSSVAREGGPTCAQLHSRATSAGIPSSPAVL